MKNGFDVTHKKFRTLVFEDAEWQQMASAISDDLYL